MKLGWVGFHMEGIPALEAVLEAGAPVVAVLTLKPAVAASRSGAADYRPLCRRFGVAPDRGEGIHDPPARPPAPGVGGGPPGRGPPRRGAERKPLQPPPTPTPHGRL